MTFYVNMVDGFMSGWGGAARGRSILIIECATLYQAETIEQAAKDRREMSRVSVTEKPRRGRPGDHISHRKFEDMGGPWTRFYNPANDTKRAASC